MWFFKRKQSDFTAIPAFDIVVKEKLRMEPKIKDLLKKHTRRPGGQVDGMVEVYLMTLNQWHEQVIFAEMSGSLSLVQTVRAWSLKRWINSNRKLLEKLRDSARHEPA